MDRQKQDELPKMQVGFINAICLPIYKELFELHPSFKPLYDGVLNNRDMWQSLADEAEAGTEHLLVVTEGVGWGWGHLTNENCPNYRPKYAQGYLQLCCSICWQVPKHWPVAPAPPKCVERVCGVN